MRASARARGHRSVRSRSGALEAFPSNIERLNECGANEPLVSLRFTVMQVRDDAVRLVMIARLIDCLACACVCVIVQT